MKKLAIAIIFAVLALCAAAKFEKLRIGTISKPDDCKDVTRKGDRLTMHYRGSLAETGEVFDESYKRNQPFNFVLGQGRVIRGFDLGAEGMCVGEKRRLEIPSNMGYGPAGAAGVIPPDADLIFEIELVKMKHPREKKEEKTEL